MLPPAAAQGGMQGRVKGGEPRPSGARRKLRPRFSAPESAGIFRHRLLSSSVLLFQTPTRAFNVQEDRNRRTHWPADLNAAAG
ncbi:Bromodomain Adjacent To Zinc Finger Domain Protein 2A [Manis pentadactyla]|nr:Bromodomain Adjacent To Zinc Finger Domain Protein 2A [Manis pentadactyla]